MRHVFLPRFQRAREIQWTTELLGALQLTHLAQVRHAVFFHALEDMRAIVGRREFLCWRHLVARGAGCSLGDQRPREPRRPRRLLPAALRGGRAARRGVPLLPGRPRGILFQAGARAARAVPAARSEEPGPAADERPGDGADDRAADGTAGRRRRCRIASSTRLSRSTRFRWRTR